MLAGFAGGIGRGLVEGPFEFIKTRRQLGGDWEIRELLKGSGATILRNSFLFSSFMIYIDLSQLLVPGGLGPFWTGAICSNLGEWMRSPLSIPVLSFLLPPSPLCHSLADGVAAGRGQVTASIRPLRRSQLLTVAARPRHQQQWQWQCGPRISWSGAGAAALLRGQRLLNGRLPPRAAAVEGNARERERARELAVGCCLPVNALSISSTYVLYCKYYSSSSSSYGTSTLLPPGLLAPFAGNADPALAGDYHGRSHPREDAVVDHSHRGFELPRRLRRGSEREREKG